MALTVGFVAGVVVVVVIICCVVHRVKRRKTPNREAGVEIPMSPTLTTPATRSTQEPHQPEGSTFLSPSVGYAPVPTNVPSSESPPPYPTREGEPQYPPPGQSYPWQQSGGSAPVSESP